MTNFYCPRCARNDLVDLGTEQIYCNKCNIVVVRGDLTQTSDTPDVPQAHEQLGFDRDTQLQHMYRHDSPQTSVEAAKSILPRLSELQQKILDILAIYPGGLTVSQICEKLDQEKPSISPRPGELIDMNLVFEDGTRKSNRGRQATVYKHHTYKDAK